MSTQTTYTATSLPRDADREFERAVAQLEPVEEQLRIGGDRRPGGARRYEQRSPADHRHVVGTFAAASDADVEAAIAAARTAFPAWAATPVPERLAILRRAARLVGERRANIAVAAAMEVGKNRVEAMGEADEAQVLIEYYATQMERGYDQDLEAVDPDDVNRSVLRPYGVFGVIAPFNFPLALVVGPAAAAMMAGNAVVAKPSQSTSLTSCLFADALADAGLPRGVFNLVTGGDEPGRALVAADGLDGVVFTGSYAVGRSIATAFATQGAYARPCIVEMGGKNPAIVTAGANLDDAAAGIARSAFSLSGQKCSAASRVLVDPVVHDDLVARLAAHASALRVAHPLQPDCDLGPVHTAAAYERYALASAQAKRDGAVAAGGRYADGGELAHGFYVEPTVVTDLPVGHPLTRDELFLPFLVVERTASLEEALERANNQVYGLTAGLFSEDRREIELFLDRIEAGTVFVNRAAGATSGGWPGQQSYAGWKGSGSTGRGGLGPRYVEQFLREQGRNVVGGRA